MNHPEETTFSVGTIVVTPEFEGAGHFLASLLKHAARFQPGRRKRIRRQIATGHRFDLLTGEKLLLLLEADEQVTTIMTLEEGALT